MYETLKRWTKRLLIVAGFILAINVAMNIVLWQLVNIVDAIKWLLINIGVL